MASHSRTPETLPEGLQGKNFTIKIDRTTKDPEVFFAEAGQIDRILPRGSKDKLAIRMLDDELKNWERGSFTNPSITGPNKHLEKLTNKETGESFVAVPVGLNHFLNGHQGTRPHDAHIIIEEKTFLKNKDFSVLLNHEQVPLTKRDNVWTVDPDSKYAGYIGFKGGMNTITPNEIYVLNEEELNSYGKSGSRKGWKRANADKTLRDPSIMVFEKVKDSEYKASEVVERRYAKEMTIDGEKKYIISNKENIQNIYIKSRPTVSADKTETSKTGSSAEQEKPEKDNSSARQTKTSRLEKMVDKAFTATTSHDGFKSAEDKNILKKHVDDLKKEIRKYSDPESAEALNYFRGHVASKMNIENLQEKERIFLVTLYQGVNKAFQDEQESLKRRSEEGTRGFGGQPHPNAFSPHKQNETPPQQQMAASVAGLAAGTVAGSFQVASEAVRGVASGITNTLGRIVDKHHERKMARMENPELDAQELASKQDRIQKYRVEKADQSNSAIDAKMESVLQSQKAINSHPTVQAIHSMIDQDPSKLWEGQEMMSDLLKEDKNLKKHHDNIMRNVKDITNSMTDNLEKNMAANLDLDKRKEKLEGFNKALANDPLADTLRDEEDNQKTLRESLAQMAHKIAEVFKELMMKIKNKFRPEGQQAEDAATPAM